MLKNLLNITVANGLTPPEDILDKPNFEKILTYIPILLGIGIAICIFFVIKDTLKQKKSNKNKDEEEHE